MGPITLLRLNFSKAKGREQGFSKPQRAAAEMLCWENEEKLIAKAAFEYLREKLDARGRERWHNKEWMYSTENAPGRVETERQWHQKDRGWGQEGKSIHDQIIWEVRRWVKLPFSVEDSH